MLSQLTNWFRSHALKPAVRFTAGRRRFRGQFEQLEARTVLSASFGSLSASFEWGSSAGPEGPSPQTVEPNYSSSASADTKHHWEDSPLLPASDAHDVAGPVDMVGSTSIYNEIRDAMVERPAIRTYLITVYTTSVGRSIYQDTAPNWSPVANSYQRQAATSPFPNWQPDSQPGPSKLPQKATAAADSFSRLLVMPFDTSDEVDRSSKATVRGRDSAFQSYSNDSLLLAATFDGSYDADFYRTADERQNTPDQDAAFTALHESALDGDELSLDALEHEREALEAVFAVLSDLEGPTQATDEDEAEEYEPPNTKPQHDGHDEAVLLDTIYAAATRHDLAHGGMVLLEPAGDSNVNAYDLLQVIASTEETTIDMPLGVEASIGTYHAFDIGTADVRPTTNDVAPLSTRPTDGPSNASAEVAPTKRGEQAS